MLCTLCRIVGLRVNVVMLPRQPNDTYLGYYTYVTVLKSSHLTPLDVSLSQSELLLKLLLCSDYPCRATGRDVPKYAVLRCASLPNSKCTVIFMQLTPCSVAHVNPVLVLPHTIPFTSMCV